MSPTLSSCILAAINIMIYRKWQCSGVLRQEVYNHGSESQKVTVSFWFITAKNILPVMYVCARVRTCTHAYTLPLIP